MGTPQPTQLLEAQFNQEIWINILVSGVSLGILCLLVFIIFFSSIRQKTRPKYSLMQFVLAMLLMSIFVMSVQRWRGAVYRFEVAKDNFKKAMLRYQRNQTDGTAKLVTIGKPFYIAKNLITQQQFGRVVREKWNANVGDDLPVDHILSSSVKEFCENLTARTGMTIRLPTEEEWEYCCRAGSGTDYYAGDSEADLDRSAWYMRNSAGSSHPVGKKVPNNFGLYDMQGNMWQLCEMQTGALDTVSKLLNDGSMESDRFDLLILRGGAWCSGPADCRVSRRYQVGCFYWGEVGFRVIADLEFK